ncbi:MAG TPA: hypothetical protein PLM77_19015, partial [Phycisphaerae bacterium]|jgi:glycosyltransferase involved in cell wall biosynthesis|nr:hypothetical protein [Phycisphaerae bacterium]HQE45283.1 hypothetical protein [Phycisphaerae bacterium]
MRTIAHVTHEAVQKVGGIGAVLQGLLTSRAYQAVDQRTILIGPLFPVDGGGRLGPHGEVLYSSLDGITQHPMSEALDRVRREFHVGIVYGHRTYIDPHTGAKVSPEVVLIDTSRMDLGRVNAFKGELWTHYGIDSKRYEESWEYDLYVKLAPPAIAVLKALGAVDHGGECVILAHEFMGMPTALAGKLDRSGLFRAIFYAHEVSSMRRIVEGHSGHDVTFYNVLSSAIQNGRYVEDVFGDQHGYYRHALVEAARFCDRIFAVGDYVVKELRFMGPAFADVAIDTVYNGVPAEKITLDQRRISQKRLKDYAEILLGDRPDYIFTHVTRLVVSKALWRDLRVLEQLEPAFRKAGKSAVLFVLSTEIPSRRPEDIRKMERWWKWPVAHREVDPDLSHGEALFYQGVQEFNARSRNIKIVYVNQFGWERAVCGDRMPADMTFMDIRRGSDLEFGQSIYEPFGIAPLEPLTFGAVCVVSEVSGCAGFAQKAIGGEQVRNLILTDYCDLGGQEMSEQELLAIGQEWRDEQERRVAAQVAQRILAALPTDDASAKALLTKGYEIARRLSWEVVAGEFVLPGIDSVCHRPRVVRVA